MAWAEAGRLELPPLSGPVVDQAGVLNPSTVQKLDSLLRRVNERGVMQLQVLTLNSLQDIPIEQASIQIVDQWKLGTKEKDNGVLFLIVPDAHKMRIEVGQGLEGDIPDVIAKRIISDVVAPYFRENLFNEGVTAGVVEILRYGDPDAIGTKEPSASRSKKGLPGWVIFLFLFVFLLRFVMGHGVRSRRVYGWGPGGLGRGGGFGGGWGSGGGGGWSGGGGGFSGGGASGDW
jgi:uncharacterized protein